MRIVIRYTSYNHFFTFAVPIPMTLAFDAKRAFFNLTGLGNYSRLVIESLADSFPEMKLLLFVPGKELQTQWQFPFSKKNISVITSGKKSRIYNGWWRRKIISQELPKHGVNIYHGPSNELPAGIGRSGVKSVVTIHDLIFRHHPEYYRAVDRQLYEMKTRQACEQADLIIAISGQTKKDILHFYNVPENKVHVVHQAVQPRYFRNFSSEEKKSVAEKYHLPENFILNVGTIERRKNLLHLLRAFNDVKDQLSADVVVVGRPKPYKKRVDAFLSEKNLSGRVHFLQHISDDDLPVIYSLARMMVYPSRIEGFGLPVAEAVAAGIPVITTDDHVFREAGGPASVYLPPDEVPLLSVALLEVMFEEPRRQKMISEGKKYAEQFMPEAMAGRLMESYRKLSE